MENKNTEFFFDPTTTLITHSTTTSQENPPTQETIFDPRFPQVYTRRKNMSFEPKQVQESDTNSKLSDKSPT